MRPAGVQNAWHWSTLLAQVTIYDNLDKHGPLSTAGRTSWFPSVVIVGTCMLTVEYSSCSTQGCMRRVVMKAITIS